MPSEKPTTEKSPINKPASSKSKLWWIFGISGCCCLLIIVGVISIYAIFKAVKKASFSGESPLSKCIDAYGKSESRQTADQPDDNSGYQIHLIYAIPNDGTDRGLDTNGTIAISVSAWQNWLCNQTGGKKMVLDTYKGTPDITFVQLDATDQMLAKPTDLPYSVGDTDPAQYQTNDLDIHLKKLGFNDPKKLYAVYYDGSSSLSCGASFAGMHVAAEFLRGKYYDGPNLITCNDQVFATNYLQPQYRDFASIHEIVHALGFVPTCAAHYTNLGSITFSGTVPSDIIGHVSDDNYDLMYTGDKSWMTGTQMVLDKNHDDYYNTQNSNCRDLKNSIFLEGGGQETPPKWDQDS